MDKQIDVSVVIAAYNSQKYIRQCVDSLLCQTLKNIEIIIVDDGSEDATLDILKEYEATDSRVTVLSQTNSGAGPARNFGIEKARGKYLIVLDSDDFFDPEMLKKLYALAEANDVEQIIFGAYIVDDKTGAIHRMGNLINESIIPDEQVFSADEIKNRIFQLTYTVAWNKFYLCEFVKKNDLKFQAIKVIDDLAFEMFAMSLCDRMMIYNEPLLYYRYNNNNSQIRSITKFPLNSYLALKEVYELMQQRGIYEKFRESFVNYALSESLLQLSRMQEYEAFRKLYVHMQEKGFADLDILPENQMLVHSEADYKAYEEIMNNDISAYLFEKKSELEECVGKQYRLPKEAIQPGSKVVIYGAGVVGRSYYSQLICSGEFYIAGWVDREFNILRQEGLPVDDPKTLIDKEFDYIVIAHLRSDVAQNIIDYLQSMGIPNGKIKFSQPQVI